MYKDKLSELSPEDLKIISEAEHRLSSKCGHDVALIAYNVK